MSHKKRSNSKLNSENGLIGDRNQTEYNVSETILGDLERVNDVNRYSRSIYLQRLL